MNELSLGTPEGFAERINVTKTFLPPLDEFVEYLKQIWDTVWLTNQGPLLHEFETKVAGYLGVGDLQLLSNGTIALQLALRAADAIGGEPSGRRHHG